MKVDNVGEITPSVLVSLGPGEKVLADHGIFLHMDPGIKLNRRSLKSLGVSLAHLMVVEAATHDPEKFFFVEYEGPGNITLSRDKGGEVRALSLAPGETLRLRQGHLMVFEPTVRYNPMIVAQWRVPNDQNPHYLVADVLTGPGTVVVQGHGNLLTFDLPPGETIRCTPSSYLLASATVGLQVRTYFLPNPTGIVTRPLTQMLLTGPGRVIVQSG
jgi:uncharacterized protein (AIM24 family)